jgi:DNA-binding NarL/FixJ family response regulator
MEQSGRPAAPRILSVGQCGFDHMSISGYLVDRFNAQVEAANGLEDARSAMRSARFNLVLVNRVLDQDGSSGLDLIHALREESGAAGIPMMLVSDLPEAQRAACTLGAAPGFGKAELYGNETFERIRLVLEGS